MRIAVIGAHGQVARALREVSAADVDVIAVARPELDLTAPGGVLPALRKAQPDVTVNAAGYTAVDSAEKEPALAFAINETGARAVAEAAATLGVPFVHLSTDYVFDGQKNAPYVETDPPNPLNVYGKSKLGGERAVLAAPGQGLVLRASWVYGQHGSNFVRTMLRLARDRDTIDVVADQTGTPMSAPDIAAAIVSVARQMALDPSRRGLFHLGGEGTTTWAGFAESIFEASRERGGPHARVRPITSAEFGAPARRPAYSVLDGSKLEAEYGLRLRDWREAVAETVAQILAGESAG